ncbi:MAG: hypothetical protein ACREEC_02070 [Thermoplasmata archaeon]
MPPASGGAAIGPRTLDLRGAVPKTPEATTFRFDRGDPPIE